MGWFSNLFGKKEVEAAKPSPNLLSFNIVKTDISDSANPYDDTFVGLELKNKDGFIDFLRNHSDLKVSDYSDQELAHTFMYQYCQRWLMENAKSPLFVETHTFMAHGEIKYDRAWNSPFVGSVTNLGFDQLPPSEDELMEMYMNYIYGTRLIEEQEAMEAANPQSISHPELTNPDNKFKG